MARQRVALVGDTTTTGGKILTGENNVRSEGMPTALVGDKAFCPKCDQTGIIVEGCPVFMVEGKPAAYNTCLIACGCPVGTNRVIATNSFMFVDDSGTPYSIPIPNQFSSSNRSAVQTNNYVDTFDNQSTMTISSGFQSNKVEVAEEVEAYLITTYGFYISVDWELGEFGDHSALYIHIKTESPFLYDPNGSYLGGIRGSGGFFSNEEADLTSYIDYQNARSDKVVKTKITLTEKQAQSIIDKAIELGDSSIIPLYCALFVSDVLKEDYGNEGTTFRPNSLRDEIEQMEKNNK